MVNVAVLILEMEATISAHDFPDIRSPPGLASLAATHWFMGWADKLISLRNSLILILELAVIDLLRYLCPLIFFLGFFLSLVDKVNWPLPPRWHHIPVELWGAFQDCNLETFSCSVPRSHFPTYG